MNQLNIDRKTLDELKAAYEAARQQGLESFEFMTYELLTDYAKYLIEYGEMKLKENK